MTDAMTLFDRGLVRRHRDRAAPMLAAHDFLLREVAERLLDRLDDVKRTFPLALDLGCHTGEVGDLLGGRGGIERLVGCDLAPDMVRAAAGKKPDAGWVVADEEALPFAEGRFDLILSCLGLHWVNDLPGALIQARRALKPDGLFLAALFGGETLRELRESLATAEVAEEGGLSPRVSPFAEVRDLGGLLQRAGFALPVVDAETITVSYGEPLRLMADLRGMGETNATHHRRRTPTPRRTIAAAVAAYRAMFGDAEGRVPATFQVLFLTGWAPDASQPRPAKRGSGQVSLSAVLGDDPQG